MKRSILLCFGWLASGFAVVAPLWYLELYWNLFNFHPHWDAKALGCGVLVLLALVGMWFLARASRDRGSQVTPLLICIALSAFGVWVCRPEPISAGWLGRSAPSPLWFREGLALVLFFPATFWVLWVCRSWGRKAPPGAGGKAASPRVST